LRGLPWSLLDPLRDRLTGLTVVGGLTGSPQVSIPGAEVDGLPLGLSIVGARGGDATLIAIALALEANRRPDRPKPPTRCRSRSPARIF